MFRVNVSIFGLTDEYINIQAVGVWHIRNKITTAIKIKVIRFSWLCVLFSWKLIKLQIDVFRFIFSIISGGARFLIWGGGGGGAVESLENFEKADKKSDKQKGPTKIEDLISFITRISGILECPGPPTGAATEYYIENYLRHSHFLPLFLWLANNVH